MEVNEVFEKVKNLFVEELGIDAEKVTMEAKLEADLEIDSLGIVEVAMAFEDEYQIVLPDDEIGELGCPDENKHDEKCEHNPNVEDLTNYLKTKFV